jgi:hypothetical protein
VAALWDWGWLRRSEPLDRMRLLAIARNHGWDANALAALIHIESGGDPGIVNKKSGASGLIQWMPDTAKDYGTTIGKIRSMSAFDQLALAERYWQNVYRAKPADVGDYYMGGFAPQFMGVPEDTVITVNGVQAVKGKAVYDQNPGLDWNADGILTAGDVRSTFRSFYAAWHANRESGKVGDLDLVTPAVGPPFPRSHSAKPWAWVAVGTIAAGIFWGTLRGRRS